MLQRWKKVTSLYHTATKFHLPMDVQFTIVWEIIVDDQWDLWDIQTPSPDISRNQNSAVQKKMQQDQIQVLDLLKNLKPSHQGNI